MSMQESVWAFQATPRTPLQKLVLIALADCAGMDGVRHDAVFRPSKVAEFCLTNEERVYQELGALLKQGFVGPLTDIDPYTGKRLEDGVIACALNVTPPVYRRRA